MRLQLVIVITRLVILMPVSYNGYCLDYRQECHQSVPKTPSIYDIQHNDIQHNDTQHNETQHNGRVLLG